MEKTKRTLVWMLAVITGLMMTACTAKTAETTAVTETVTEATTETEVMTETETETETEKESETESGSYITVNTTQTVESTDTGKATIAETTPAAVVYKEHIVEKGESLLTISRKYYGNKSMVSEIMKLNLYQLIF